LACALVALWMLSIGGLAFITEENLSATWPGSFLMRTYAKTWLANTGLALTPAAFLQSFVRTLFFAGVAWQVYLLIWQKRHAARSILLRIGVFAALLAYCAFQLHGHALDILAAVFFPQDMVVYVVIAALLAGWRVTRTDDQGPGLASATALIFAGLLAMRTLMKTNPWGYSIYYNGPAVLVFLILARPIIPRIGQSRRFVLRAELVLCLGCLAAAAWYSARFAADLSDRVALTTERGTILVQNQVANSYRAAIALMKKESERGEMVLSVPEDTSLYFLSGTQSPTRLFFFIPGVLAPGKMTDDVIHEIETKPVRYILWSNRTFSDYGVPRFGVDFDQTLGNYLISHYRRVGPLIPDADLDWETQFTLWERRQDLQSQ
jgi:hypothetical protein